jgi:hypothetical protein
MTLVSVSAERFVQTPGFWEGKRVKTLSLQEPGSGQIQYTSWRNFAPFTTPIHKDIQASARALGTAGDRQWVRKKGAPRTLKVRGDPAPFSIHDGMKSQSSILFVRANHFKFVPGHRRPSYRLGWA